LWLGPAAVVTDPIANRCGSHVAPQYSTLDGALSLWRLKCKKEVITRHNKCLHVVSPFSFSFVHGKSEVWGSLELFSVGGARRSPAPYCTLTTARFWYLRISVNADTFAVNRDHVHVKIATLLYLCVAQNHNASQKSV